MRRNDLILADAALLLVAWSSWGERQSQELNPPSHRPCSGGFIQISEEADRKVAL